MAKIEKLPSGTYRTRIYLGDVDGKKQVKSLTAPSKTELKAIVSQYKAEHRRPAGRSFSAATEAYLATSAAVLSPSTVRGYKSIARKLKDTKIYDMQVDNITRIDVQTCIDSLAAQKADITPPALRERGEHREGDKVSAKTIRNVYGFVTAVLAQYGITVKGVKLPQRIRHEIDVPEDKAMKELFATIRGTALEVPVMLAAIGGLRRGEICALTLDDLDGNVLHVHKSMVKNTEGKWVVKPPKTYGSDRYIELPDYLAGRIREQGYITRCTPSTLSDNHSRFLKRHGFPAYHLHSYRHYMVSALHAAGVPDSYIQQRGGWSTPYTMQAVYRHTLADRQKTAVDAANRHFEALL